MNSPNTTNIALTTAAALKIKHLVAEEGNPNLSLRAFISGGGCSGFQYGFTFEETINDDDLVVSKEVAEPGETAPTVVRLLVDPISYQYLKGAEIDYREDVNGEQFVIRNPNAKTTCGCGSSFSIADPDEDK